MPEPDSREPWFVCEAHAQGDIVDRVVTSFQAALQDVLHSRGGAGATGGDTPGAMSHPAGG